MPHHYPKKLYHRTAILLCAALMTAPAYGADRSLKVATFAGGYASAQKQAIFDAYTDETGIDIEMIETDDGITAVIPDQNGKAAAHIVVLDYQHARKACEEGKLAHLEASEVLIAEKNVPLTDDFVPNGLSDCSVGNSVNSLVLAYDRSKHPQTHPSTPADYFNLEKFPGKRGMRPDPHAALILASLATGATHENVYKTLESAQGVEAAFRKLKQVETEIVWWRTGQQAVDYLATNMVTMTTAFHSWVYHARVTEGRPLGLVWTGQQAQIDVWAIPKSAGKQSLAANFIRFATDKDRLAAQSNLIPYGPARMSAFPLIKDEMREHLPNTPEHGDTIVWIDHSWWEKNGTPLEKRFAVWVAKSQNM